jgi:putative transposase
MQRFKSAGYAQRVLAGYGPIVEHFRPRRHRLPACEYRQKMGQQIQIGVYATFVQKLSLTYYTPN